MKSTKAQIQLRVDDLVQFRLDGAQFWHVREYVREKEKEPGSAWYRGDDPKPLSDATLWRYIGKTDDLIADSCRSSRKKLIRGHIAKRRNLFAKAIAQGDLRTALATADSEAKLLGLFPPSGVEMTGKGGTPLYPPLESIVAALKQEDKAEGLNDASESQGNEGNRTSSNGDEALP